MSNVYFFDLRDGGTDNFNKLSDSEFILWNKKAKDMSRNDFCLIYYKKKDLLFETNVVKDDLSPQLSADGKYFVEFNGKKYSIDMVINDDGTLKYDVFVAFKILSKHTLEPGHDLVINIQGGVTRLTQSNETKFMKNKLPKLIQFVSDNKILDLLNGSVKDTIIDSSFSNSKIQPDKNDLLKLKKQIILYGPPGTGKTYMARNFAVEFLENKTKGK